MASWWHDSLPLTYMTKFIYCVAHKKETLRKVVTWLTALLYMTAHTHTHTHAHTWWKLEIWLTASYIYDTTHTCHVTHCLVFLTNHCLVCVTQHSTAAGRWMEVRDMTYCLLYIRHGSQLHLCVIPLSASSLWHDSTASSLWHDSTASSLWHDSTASTLWHDSTASYAWHNPRPHTCNMVHWLTYRRSPVHRWTQQCCWKADGS